MLSFLIGAMLRLLDRTPASALEFNQIHKTDTFALMNLWLVCQNQVLVADINIGYEDIVNTQVGARSLCILLMSFSACRGVEKRNR